MDGMTDGTLSDLSHPGIVYHNHYWRPWLASRLDKERGAQDQRPRDQTGRFRGYTGREGEMKRILELLSFCMFVLAGGMIYAFVFDVEPLTAEKRYELDRSTFYHSDDCGYRDFPSFDQWIANEEAKEAMFHEWLVNIGNKAGEEWVDTCNWAVGYRDTREGYAGAAPENAMNGRDN